MPAEAHSARMSPPAVTRMSWPALLLASTRPPRRTSPAASSTKPPSLTPKASSLDRPTLRLRLPWTTLTSPACVVPPSSVLTCVRSCTPPRASMLSTSAVSSASAMPGCMTMPPQERSVRSPRAGVSTSPSTSASAAVLPADSEMSLRSLLPSACTCAATRRPVVSMAMEPSAALTCASVRSPWFCSAMAPAPLRRRSTVSTSVPSVRPVSACACSALATMRPLVTSCVTAWVWPSASVTSTVTCCCTCVMRPLSASSDTVPPSPSADRVLSSSTRLPPCRPVLSTSSAPPARCAAVAVRRACASPVMWPKPTSSAPARTVMVPAVMLPLSSTSRAAVTTTDSRLAPSCADAAMWPPM